MCITASIIGDVSFLLNTSAFLKETGINEPLDNSTKFSEVKSSYYLTPDLEKSAYNNEVIASFYSENQLLNFKKRWKSSNGKTR